MPNYRATIRKETSGYTWTNGWRLIAPDLPSAFSAGQAIVLFEQALTLQIVTFVELLTSPDPDPSHQGFVSLALTGTGLLEVANQLIAPPNIVAFVSLHAAAGRAGKKFLRYSLRQPEYEGVADAIVEVSQSQPHAATAAAATTLLADIAAAGATLTIGDAHRPVTAVTWRGITDCDTHKKYFDLKRNPK